MSIETLAVFKERQTRWNRELSLMLFHGEGRCFYFMMSIFRKALQPLTHVFNLLQLSPKNCEKSYGKEATTLSVLVNGRAKDIADEAVKLLNLEEWVQELRIAPCDEDAAIGSIMQLSISTLLTYENRILKPCNTFPLRLIIIPEKPPLEACEARAQVCRQIIEQPLGINGKLEYNALVLQKHFAPEIADGARFGTIAAPIHSLLRCVKIKMQPDTQPNEGANNEIKEVWAHARRAALATVAAKFGLRKEIHFVSASMENEVRKALPTTRRKDEYVKRQARLRANDRILERILPFYPGTHDSGAEAVLGRVDRWEKPGEAYIQLPEYAVQPEKPKISKATAFAGHFHSTWAKEFKDLAYNVVYSFNSERDGLLHEWYIPRKHGSIGYMLQLMSSTAGAMCTFTWPPKTFSSRALLESLYVAVMIGLDKISCRKRVIKWGRSADPAFTLPVLRYQCDPLFLFEMTKEWAGAGRQHAAKVAEEIAEMVGDDEAVDGDGHDVPGPDMGGPEMEDVLKKVLYEHLVENLEEIMREEGSEEEPPSVPAAEPVVPDTASGDGELDPDVKNSIDGWVSECKKSIDAASAFSNVELTINQESLSLIEVPSVDADGVECVRSSLVHWSWLSAQAIVHPELRFGRLVPLDPLTGKVGFSTDMNNKVASYATNTIIIGNVGVRMEKTDGIVSTCQRK